jgi:hypothetical protein
MPAAPRLWTRTSRTSNVLASLPKIERMIEEGSRDPKIRLWATRILNDAGVEGRDDLGEVGAILRYAQTRIPYRKDPVKAEGLQSARFQLRSLEAGAQGADCDDFTIALGSLLGSVGYPVRFAVTRPFADLPFGHIYPEVFIPSLGGWLPADATNANAELGWEAPRYAEKRVIPMRNGPNGDLAGPLDFLKKQADKVLGVGRHELERRGILSPAASGEPVAAPQSGLPSWLRSPWPYVAAGVAVAAYLYMRRKRR